MQKQIGYILESRRYRNIYIKVKDRVLFDNGLVDTPEGKMRFRYTSFGKNEKMHKAYVQDVHGKPVKTTVLKKLLLRKNT
jgi:hypothetical protein